MHYFKCMEYLLLLLVTSLLKYCANDYLVAFIWFSSYYFFVHTSFLIVLLLLRVYMYSSLFFLPYWLFLDFMSETKYICIPSNSEDLNEGPYFWLFLLNNISACSWQFNNISNKWCHGTTNLLFNATKNLLWLPSICVVFLLIIYFFICESLGLKISMEKALSYTINTV